MYQDLPTSFAYELTPADKRGARSGVAVIGEIADSPEAKLLLHLLRHHFSPTAQRVKEHVPVAEVDWSRLCSLAMTHHVEPLVYRYFQATPEVVPAEVLSRFQLKTRATGFRNLVLTRELVRLTGLFAEAGIAVLPMKGPVLAHQIYGDVSQRQFGDLDLLVRPQQLSEARGLLEREGYLYQDGWNSWRQRAYEHFGHHYGYYHPKNSVHVEMHWRVMPRNVKFAIEGQDFWQRMECCAIAGAQVPCSPPEDLLLMLTAHGSRHRWERLNWICDIAALLKARPDMDWHVVEHRAQQLGAVRMLDLGLLVAHELLGVPLPSGAIARLQADSVTRELGRDVRRMLFTDIDFEAEVGTRWRYFLRLRERLPHQLSYVVGQTVNSLFWRAISRGQAGCG